MKRNIRNHFFPHPFLKKYTNAVVMKQRQIALSERDMQKASTTTDHVNEVCKIENNTEYATLDCIQVSVSL